MASLNTPSSARSTTSTLTSRQPSFVVYVLRQLVRRPLSLVGTLIVALFIFLAIAGPFIAPYDYDEFIRDAEGRRLTRVAPSLQHPFGIDKDSRDVFSRVLWGTREMITLPGIATGLAVLLGTTIGLAIGYRGGWIDEVASRILDSLLSIPALILALVMLGTVGPSRIGIVIVVVLLYTPIVARVVRSATLSLRDAGYVEIARLRGESTFYILFREILPGVLPALAVETALRFSYAIFLIASLGFLGLGVQPPSPDWGRMVQEARGEYAQAAWSLWFPSGAIALLVIGVNLLADGLRRAFRYEGELR
ncbi:MAG: ABC transporter permease [bacterium]|nr:ABC transporter permease [bacterium]